MASSAPPTTLALSLTPRQVYHPPTPTSSASAPLQPIRLGNGGAGPTGLLRALAAAYHASHPTAPSIEWYQNISPLTLCALRARQLDLALTYERDAERELLERGQAEGGACVFNDHFILVGPAADPAGLGLGGQDAVGAFGKLLERGAGSDAGLFLSRDDGSATNLRERHLFSLAGASWAEPAGAAVDLPSWYIRSSVFPADALRVAARDGFYTLTDAGTLGMLRNEVGGAFARFAASGELLRNTCCMLVAASPRDDVKRFAAWLLGEEGQQVVETYGEEWGWGRLFTRASVLDFP